MADRQWYTGRDGKQEGPFSDERLRELIASGMVRGDTLVWSTGMANWTKAADVPGLMPAQRVPLERRNRERRSDHYHSMSAFGPCSGAR